MRANEAEIEAEAIRDDAEGLAQQIEDHRTTFDALRARPELEGEAVAAIRRAELVAVEAETIRLETAATNLKRRSELLDERIADGRGWTRRHWAWGVLLGVAMPGLATAIWIVGYGGESARLTYFELAAQVIPILVLAVALEGRQFDLASTAPPAFKAYNVVNLLWLVAGEAAAMYVLADGEATELTFGLTTAALNSAAWMLVLIAVLGRWTLRD